MQKYTITRIYKTNVDKQGQPLMANGRPYTRMSVKVAEHGDKWISGFEGKESKNWKEGSVVEMIVEQKGDFLNFSLPKTNGFDNSKLELILTKLSKIDLLLGLINDKLSQGGQVTGTNTEIHVPTPEGVTYPEEDINPEDIPF